MLGNSHFYNRTIRKIVVAFGTMFNDIVLVRYNVAGTTEYEKTRVPLSYGAKEKYLTRLTSDPSLTKSINAYVPRMSFDMVGLSYDSTRKFNTINRNFGVNDNTGAVSGQYAPVPYNFEFDLSIYVRNQEDGTQILEQILPFFTPDFTITVDLIPKVARKYDMPVTLNSVSPEIDYEGDFSTTRLIIWNLNFTIKGYIFPPVSDSGLILQANTNIYIDSRNTQYQKVYVDSANGSGVFTTGETIRVPERNITGTVTYFANNSTGTLIVSDLNELLDENDIVVGDYSTATYTVDTIDLNPLKTVAIVTTPNPANAKTADESFGFIETRTEFPNTLS
jgi:hypothetical protein